MDATTAPARAATLYDVYANKTGTKVHVIATNGTGFACGAPTGRSQWACMAVNLPTVPEGFGCQGCRTAAAVAALPADPRPGQYIAVPTGDPVTATSGRFTVTLTPGTDAAHGMWIETTTCEGEEFGDAMATPVRDESAADRAAYVAALLSTARG